MFQYGPILLQLSFINTQMTHIAKVEQFRKSIRREELHNIFSQKRIKLIESMQVQTIEEEIDYQNINLDTLRHLARISQNQQGIQQIYDKKLEHLLEPYLEEQYLHSEEQKFASLVLCNLYMVPRPSPPSFEFTRNIIRILEMSNSDVSSNCITLIFNIAHDHQTWKQKIVKQYNICTILCQQFDKQGCTRVKAINILGTILKILHGSSFSHDSMKDFYPILVNFLSNSSCNDNEIVGHAYYCFYHLALKFPKEAISNIMDNHLLNRFLKITPLLKETKFTRATLHIIQMLVNHLTPEQITGKVFPFLQKIMENGYKGGSKSVKSSVYEVITIALEEQKIAAWELMSLNIGQLLVNHFRLEEDSEILHRLVCLFSIVIMNLELCPLTEDLERLFERAEIICPQEIEMIGFIKETQLKARQRASLLY